MILRSSTLEPMFPKLIYSLLSSVLLLLLLTKSRQAGHVKSTERVLFYRIPNIFQSTVSALVHGHLLWYVLDLIFFHQCKIIIIVNRLLESVMQLILHLPIFFVVGPLYPVLWESREDVLVQTLLVFQVLHRL